MRRNAFVSALIGALAAGCGAVAKAPESAGTGPSAIAYEARVRSSEPLVIDVRATFESGIAKGALAFPPAVREVIVEEGGRERSPEQVGRAWAVACATSCSVRYSVDLSAAAELTGDSPAVAIRSAGDVLALGSLWLMKPEPAAPMTRATLRVDTSDPAGSEPIAFAAPFPRDASGAYEILARDVGATGYTAWGRFRTATVEVTQGTIDTVILRGDKALSDDALARWVRATALAIDSVYGRFPIERTMIAIVPSDGSDEVDFGRTVPAGGASIVMYVGDRAGPAELYGDWVLAHEMIHLGIPSMPRDGMWIDEGLATYYGPVVRARAGMLSGSAAWADLARMMPKGVATPEQPVLAASDDHDRVYFGGSLFALTADVEIRAKTRGVRSLDDGLKRVLAEGGRGTEVWSSDRFVDAIDRGVGQPIVRPLLERARKPAAPCGPLLVAGTLRDLTACAPDDVVSQVRLFEALGVRAGTAALVDLDDAAPMADVRRRIVERDARVAAVVAEAAGGGASGSGSARERAGVEKP